MKTLSAIRARSRRLSFNSIIRIGMFPALIALIAIPLYSASSVSMRSKLNKKNSTIVSQDKVPTVAAAVKSSRPVSQPVKESFNPFLLRAPQSSASVATYAADCTTSKTSFAVGDTVCVQVSGIPVGSFFARRLLLGNANSTVIQSFDITTDPQTFSFVVPAISVIGGNPVDNRGLWQGVILNPFFYYPEGSTAFTVADAANPAADLGVTYTFVTNSVETGSEATFALQINNYGPDSALNVSLADAVPAGSSFVSFEQLSGPTFDCSSPTPTTCTLASMAAGDVATFLATYTANSGTQITNTAAISSATSDVNNLNNSASASAEVTTNTGAACTLSCPSNIVANNDTGTGGHIITNANFPLPTTSGTCGDVSLSVTPNPQTNNYFFVIGTSFVTAETDTGETCTFAVTINDVDNPTITCPSDITVFESPQGSGSRVVNFTPTVNDNSGSATVDCGAHPPGTNFPVGTTPVTCTATDGSGNSSESCSFNITVEAVTATCVFTPQPPIVVNSAANACGTNVTYTTPTSDGSGTCGTITCDHPSGSFFGVGETLVTCTSSPDGGQTSFTVTVNDTTPPVPDLASLPTNTRDCTANAGVPTVIQTPSGPKTIYEPPTATDNCGGSIEGTTTDPLTYLDPGTFTVHWIYTDASGNSTSQNQTVVVTGSDTTAPVPDAATLPTVTGECTASVTPPTATDDCDGTLTGTTPDPVSYTTVGTHTVHWTYIDQAGHSVSQNQSVVVTDTVAPTIALLGASTITVECHTSFTDPGVTPDDNCLLTNTQVTTTGSVNIDVPNTYTLTYTATDGGGNQASVQRTVIVQDTIKPVITLNAPASVPPVECHTSFTDPGATAADTCDTSVPVTVSGSVNVNVPGTYTLTYEAVDDSGNTATSVQRTVTVVDTTPPTISCPANQTLEPTCPSGAVATYTLPVGVDSCSASVTITRTAGPASGSVFPIGTTTVTHVADDGNGNTATCSFTVTVLTPQTVIQNLIASVNASSLTGTQKNGLLAKLNAALTAINGGGGNACAKLSDFVNSVGNLISNGSLTAAQGNAWISSANNVRNTIGCTNLGCT